MQVNSERIPSKIQLLRGKKLVNFNIVENRREEDDLSETIFYSYEQIELQKDSTEMDVEKAIEKEFRKIRDNLLVTVVDHYQKPLLWEELTTENQATIRQYRTDLMDCTITMELPTPPKF